MGGVDQAAGLRRWAEARSAEAGRPTLSAVAPSPAPPRVLMTLGLPRGGQSDVAPVSAALERWHAQGQRWVGDPDAWRIVAVSINSSHLPALLGQQGRWALWVGDGPDEFRRGYAILKRLAQRGGPKRLLLVHPALASSGGLLGNLQQAAAEFLGLQLLVITPPRRRSS